PYAPYFQKGKGAFVLCRTSNAGAKDFEYEKCADGRHIYDLVGDKLNALGKEYLGEHGYSSLGLVIGGTHIEEAKEIRTKYKDSFFLIPGYGAQGGKAEDIAQYLINGNGGVVNSSRGVLLAYQKQENTGYAEAAYNECVQMKGAIADACGKL
ncbi:MAG: orotidine 5'-phosphate decarboxylase, partial [Ruthenibacterium sp.]